MTGPVAEVLISTDDLSARVESLATEIEETYAGSSEPPLLVGVLKGSTFFLADLVRALRCDVLVDFISISHYAPSSDGRSGVVRILKDLDIEAWGRNILLVEDIVDTGLTLTYLRRTLEERGARSLRCVTLLDKAARRIVPVEVEFRGFEIPDVFVVGYGLDFQGRYRNVPELLAVKDIARLANDPLLLVDSFWPSG